ncbi:MULTISPECIES: hypothetical protein [unclassified Streptomyces]|nr:MULTISPECIES: hypothetical protein [unclassified Streptomyces]WSD22444.1 hypothetical protein OHA26_02400 [Streptomyces sp. NBC_01751]
MREFLVEITIAIPKAPTRPGSTGAVPSKQSGPRYGEDREWI